MALTPSEARLVADALHLVRNSEVLNPELSERRRSYNYDALKAAGRLGILGVRVPADQGGRGHSFEGYAAITEALARVDFGYSLAAANTANIAALLSTEANSDVAQAFLPELLSGETIGCIGITEPEAGSDLTSLKTIARKDGNGWLISGRKAWITNAEAAGVIVVYAQTEAGRGASGIASFIVDAEREGFFRDPPFNLSGPSTAGIGGFRLENYRVNEADLIHPPGVGFKSVMVLINIARTYVAAMCCGMVAEALDLAVEYGNRRQTFGKLLIQHQGWRWPIAEAMTELSAARGLVQTACERIDAGEDVQFEAAQAKLFATRMAERHLPRLAHALGAEALKEKYPLVRHQIAARAASLVDGSTEMLLERIFAGVQSGSNIK